MTSFSAELEKAKLGVPESLDWLCRHHVAPLAGSIHRRLCGFLRRHYDTVDLTQSVMVEALDGLAGFEDRGEAAFRRWLEIKAQSKIASKYRRHLSPRGCRRELTLVPGAESALSTRETGPIESAIRNENTREVQGALASLDEHYRLVLRLRHEEALTFPEVARWMNLPGQDAARKLYARALLRLGKTWRRS